MWVAKGQSCGKLGSIARSAPRATHPKDTMANLTPIPDSVTVTVCEPGRARGIPRTYMHVDEQGTSLTQRATSYALSKRQHAKLCRGIDRERGLAAVEAARADAILADALDAIFEG